MEWLAGGAIAALTTTVVLVAVNLYLYLQYQERFIWLWFVGWVFYALRFAFELVIIFSSPALFIVTANQMATFMSGILLAWGTDVFLGNARVRVWMAVTLAGCLWIVAGNFFDISFVHLCIPVYIFLGVINLWIGVTLIGSGLAGAGIKLTGLTFIVWGLHKLDYPLLRDMPWVAPWGFLLGAFLALVAAIGMLMIYFEREIAERKAAEQHARRLSDYDGLTGLPNRRRLRERLDDELTRARRSKTIGAVLFIDLDDLKMINDTFGHTCGDGVIIEAGAYIFAELRADDMVARIGGDEFIVLLTNKKDRDEVARFATNISQALSRDYDVGEATTHLSASIGIALFPENGETAEELYKNADLALYAAKGSGKSGWRFYEESMRRDALETMSIRQSLRHAINRGELSLHYQPIISLPYKKIVGFEALLRWASLEHGAIPPGRFIPLAEQSGWIIPLGQWVLKEACGFARRLADLGHGNVTVAVNISPRQLEAGDFVSVIRDHIEGAGIGAGQLEIEVTENVAIGSLDDSILKLKDVRDLGVRLALDDFGTGYSSLTYLKSLPVTNLKLDKSFMDKIFSDNAQFVGAIIDMAHSMGFVVVAEGVESERQAEELVKCGCDCMQGYLFSRPIPEQEAIGLLMSTQ